MQSSPAPGHRLAGPFQLGGMLRRSQPNLLLTALRSDLVAEGFVQSGLENLQGLPKPGCLNHISCLTHTTSQPCCHGLDGGWRQWGASPPKQQVVPGDTLSMDLPYQSCTLRQCNPPKLCLVCPGWLSESSLSFLLCLTPSLRSSNGHRNRAGFSQWRVTVQVRANQKSVHS